MSGSLAAMFNTALTPTGEQLYQQQVPPGASADYDMRGAFARMGGALLPEGQHYPDTFKKPNHPTFSTGSQYARPEQPGGAWVPLPGPGAPWTFTPSETNTGSFGLQNLQRYFQQYEPNSLLLQQPGT